MSNEPWFTKNPSEILAKGFDCSDRLPDGVTIETATAAAVSIHDDEAANEILEDTDATVSQDGLSVLIGLTGGDANVDYRISLTLNLSDGSRPIYPMVMQVRE